MSDVLDRTYTPVHLSERYYDVGAPASALRHPDTLSSSGLAFTPEYVRSLGGPMTVISVSLRNLPRLRVASRRVEDLLALKKGWDSYGAHPINPEVAEQCLRLIAALLDNGLPDPTIVPTAAGGLQLEWHSERIDFELEFESPSSLTYYFKDTSGEMYEGSVARNTSPLAALLAQVATGLGRALV